MFRLDIDVNGSVFVLRAPVFFIQSCGYMRIVSAVSVRRYVLFCCLEMFIQQDRGVVAGF